MLVAIIVRRGQAPSKRRGHHAARPRGALIETSTRTHTRRRHRVACPRGAMIRPDPPLSDQHPTGINPVVMVGGRRSHAGCDYRPTGASPISTATKRANREWGGQVLSSSVTDRPRECWLGRLGSSDRPLPSRAMVFPRHQNSAWMLTLANGVCNTPRAYLDATFTLHGIVLIYMFVFLTWSWLCRP